MRATRSSRALISVLIFALSCERHAPQAEAALGVPVHVREQPAPAPAAAARFLAELDPEPVQPIRVRMQLSGPGKLRGGVELLAASGGRRRAIVDVSGDNPSMSAGVESQLVFKPGDLVLDTARAYTHLGPNARRAVLETIRHWHASVPQQPDRRAGRIAGKTCTLAAVGDARVCMWGSIPLLVRTPLFSLTATSVEELANREQLPGLPADAQRRDAARSITRAAAALEQLAAGESSPMPALLAAMSGQ